MLKLLSNIVRAEGDPRVLRTGPSSLAPIDRLGRGLGWIGIGLGALELMGARRVTQAFGLEGCEPLVRAFGVREIASGILTLSTEKQRGLWSRLGGDGLDVAVLLAALGVRSAKRERIGLALAGVIGIALLDAFAAEQGRQRHSRHVGHIRSYRHRTGFPHGVEAARGSVPVEETERIPNKTG